MPSKRKSSGRERAAKAAKRPLVLIVDDFVDNREMYTEYLEFAGYRVVSADNGQSAIDVALAEAPEVIIMDLSLPVMDGWEATRRLKADPRTSAIPVIALTGHALKGNEDAAREAGCDAFVAKPCLPDDLVAHVEAARTSRTKARAAR